MNLQDMMTSREIQEKESKFGSNLKESNTKYIYDLKECDNFENDLNKNDKNNSSNYSYTRSNMIEKEIENNIENKNKHKIKNGNKIDITKSDRKLYGGDMISELVERIKKEQNFNIPKEEPRKSLVNWDEELKLGLEQIKKIPTKISRNNTFYNPKELENQKFKKSKKYNEVISLLTKSLNMQINKGSNYSKNGAFFYYKNIRILKPIIYFNNNRMNNKVYQPIRKNKNKFYLSSIDGKAIIDGERKNPDNFDAFMERMRNQKNNNTFFENNNLTMRRSFSTSQKNFHKIDKCFPYFGVRKVNYYNKNYFMDEINRINNLLFS